MDIMESLKPVGEVARTAGLRIVPPAVKEAIGAGPRTPNDEDELEGLCRAGREMGAARVYCCDGAGEGEGAFAGLGLRRAC